MCLEVTGVLIWVDTLVEILGTIVAFDFHGALTGDELESALREFILHFRHACREPGEFRKLYGVSIVPYIGISSTIPDPQVLFAPLV
jgi:hypothetical protein